MSVILKTKNNNNPPIVAEGAISIASGSDYIDTNGFALFVGSGGTVKVELKYPSGSAISFNNISNGTFMPILAVKVFATSSGTTATNMLALY